MLVIVVIIPISWATSLKHNKVWINNIKSNYVSYKQRTEKMSEQTHTMIDLFYTLWSFNHCQMGHQMAMKSIFHSLDLSAYVSNWGMSAWKQKGHHDFVLSDSGGHHHLCFVNLHDIQPLFKTPNNLCVYMIMHININLVGTCGYF